MEAKVCCVCHQPVDEDAPRLGRRSYCAEHYAKVNEDRGSVWRSAALTIGILFVFAIVVALIFRWIPGTLEGTPLVLLGIVLALVPAILWPLFDSPADIYLPSHRVIII